MVKVALVQLMGPVQPGLRPPDIIPFRWLHERDNYARTALASGRFFLGRTGKLPCA
jgi:hypothetical protein